MVTTGITGHLEEVVTPEMSAARVGSGLVDVLATPMMIALIEKTCNECVLPHLEAGQGTVGTLVNVAHTAAPSACASGATPNWSRSTDVDWCSV